MTDLAVLDGGLNAQKLAAMTDGDGSLIMLRSSEHRRASYRYAGQITPVANPTDVILIEGSATLARRIKRFVISGNATTAGSMTATLIRRTNPLSLGSSIFNPVIPAAMDPNDPPVTGPFYTISVANLGAVGNSEGSVGQGRLFFSVPGTAPPSPIVWEFATRQSKALILRGNGDYLALNLNGGAVPAGGTIDFEVEVEEDTN